VAGENRTVEIYQELINRGAVPQEHQATVDELMRRGVLKPQAPKEAPVSAPEGTLRQFNDALTFGYYDKAVAAAKAAMGGQPYEETIKRERERTGEAGQQTLPWLVGQTAGNIAQTVATGGAGPVLQTGKQAAQQAIRPATNALTAYLQGIPEATRYGAAYGAASAGGHADGTVPEQLDEIAQGVGKGAILGPALYSGFYGAGLAIGARQRWAERRADANRARAEEARAVGIETPLPAIVSDNPVISAGSRAVGAGIGGSPIGARAAENTNQLTAHLNRTLGRPIEGLEAGDLGQEIQADLRRRLTMPSRDLSGATKAELEGIAGPVTSEGFAPPRPVVERVQPRDVEAIQPRDVGPPPIPPDAAESAQALSARVAERERAIQAAVAEHNRLAEAAREVEARYKPTFDQYGELAKQEQGLRETIDRMSQGGSFIKMRQPGETVDAYRARIDGLIREHADTLGAMKKMQPDYDLAQRALEQYGNTEGRVNAIRDLHAQRDRLTAARDRFQAQSEAQRVKYEQETRDYNAARQDAAASAADETARLREQARLEAETATSSAQRAADNRYQRRLAEQGGFRTGGSRESYPTELSAAYELAHREAPKIRVNPLGDVYMGTNTSRLLDAVAREGKRDLSIRGSTGKAFDPETGGLTEPFQGYLRSRIGNDMTERLQVLAELRNRGIVSQPVVDGMKSLLSDMRALAREAERSRYSPQPRTEDAALLRRLAGAIKTDVYEALSKAGGPEGFRTASGEYKILPGGGSQATGKLPSDETFFVTPENFQRLTRGTGRYDATYSVPAQLSLKAEKNNQLGYFRNQAGEFDRSSLIPYERNPEVGLVPIQVWDDGTRVSYGSPVISRETTTGERAVSMFKNADQQYENYVNELRKPLSVIFGDKVQGVQALDRLAVATRKGETGILGPYMRVMEEKSDPLKGASAIIYHMTGGGRDLSLFIDEWQKIPDVSKRVLFGSPQGRALENELNRYVAVGQRLERFQRSAQAGAIVDPSRITHIMTLAAAYTHLPAVLSMVAGNAVAARVLSSPRLVRWMTEIPAIGRGGFDTPAFQQHLAQLGGLAGKDKPAGDALAAATRELLGIAPAKAESMNQAANRSKDQMAEQWNRPADWEGELQQRSELWPVGMYKTPSGVERPALAWPKILEHDTPEMGDRSQEAADNIGRGVLSQGVRKLLKPVLSPTALETFQTARSIMRNSKYDMGPGEPAPPRENLPDLSEHSDAMLSRPEAARPSNPLNALTPYIRQLGEYVIPPARGLTLSEGLSPIDRATKQAAEAMYGAGASHDEVWKQHGVAKLIDDKYLHEIDDSKAQLNDNALDTVKRKLTTDTDTVTIKLPELIQHGELFKKIPEARNVLVQFHDLGRGAYGLYFGGANSALKNQLIINKSLVNNKELMLGTILHEFQHYIDLNKKEGMRAAKATADTAKSRATEINQDLQREFPPRSERRSDAMRAKAWIDYASTPTEANAFNTDTRTKFDEEARRTIPPWYTVNEHLEQQYRNIKGR
jgi:hypothetical protein